ncbi:unnamed protein product [Paramecium octaurelia]|uniref:Transmembrane protein n=1 Tax=Paramecium octaurelia TaxID=43137 RepID=A0A8S1WBR8_PAROT|nr:unnamed protein product [Paramecium octaurelia]
MMIVLKHYTIIPKRLSLFLQLVILIQPIFMVMETGLQMHHIDNSVPHLIILLLFRQDLLLLDQNFHQAQLYLIVLAFQLFQKALQIPITFYLYRIKEKALYFQQIDQSNLIQKGLLILATLMQLQLTALHLLSSTFCLMSLTFAFRSGDQYVHLFLSIFTYVSWQVDYIFTFSLCSTPLTYKYHYLDITKVTILHYIIYLLQQLQIIIFCVIEDNQEIKLVNIILLLIEIISQLTNQFINYIYIFKESRLLLYFTIAFKITFSCYYLQPTVSSQYLIIPLLIYPIILYAFLALDSEINNRLFANIFKDSASIPLLIHQLKMILNQCDTNIKMNPLKSSLINNYHRKNCENQDCICSNKLYILEISQANAITQAILKQFLRSRINNIMDTKELSKNSQVIDLFYVQTLFYFDFGWLTDSIKNVIHLLSCSENNQNLVIKNFIQKPKNIEAPLKEATMKQDVPNQQISQYIYVKIQLDMTEYCRLNYVLHLAKFKLKSFLGTSMQAFQQLMVSDFITSFLKYDKCLRDIQSQTLNLIHEKINFYHSIIEDEKRNLNNLAVQTKKICVKLTQMKKRLKQVYDQYPCRSMQRCLCFFQSELLNNYYEASKTSSITSMADDKIFRNKKIRNYEIQVEQTAYLILSIKGELDDFNIEQGSSSLLSLIGYDTYKDLQFYQLLPKFMRSSHPKIINMFFMNGQSRFYKSFNQSFIQTKTGLLKTVFLTYDITKIILNQNLVFAAFLQELPDQKCFMLSHGSKGKLIFSENFFQKIGFDQRVILNLPTQVINSLSMQYLIPDFPMEHSETETSQFNTEMRFLMDRKLKELQVQGTNLSEYILDLEQWEKDDQVCLYNISVMITKRYIEQQSYLLIEISSITRITKFSQDASKFQTIQNFDITPQKSPVNRQRKNSVSIASLMNLSLEAQAKKVKVMDVRKKEIQMNDYSEDEAACYISSFRKDELQNHAPFQSQRQLLSERKNDTQQEFFNVDLLRMDSNIKSSLEIQQSQTSKKKRDQNEEVQSQQSSIGGVKESQLFKKFEMIEKIIKSKKFKTMMIYIMLLIMLTMFWVSFTIVVVTVMSSQLLEFIQEIDMISLHASIMGPHDMYLSIKVTVSAYQQLYREKYIDQSTFLKLINPLFEFNAPYYFDLQSSFYEVLTDVHLTDFFIDKYQTVYFMGNNDTVIYSRTLSFREELLAIISAQYQFKRIFDERSNAAGQPCQVFQFANYLNLQDQLEQLTDEILQFSKMRSVSSNEQWLVFWIVYQITSILLIFALVIVRRRMLKTYEKLLSLFYYSDRSSLEQEILKLKNLHQTISIQNQEFIKKYEFDFKQREEQLNHKKNNIHQQKIEKQKLRKSDNQLPQFFTYLGIFIMYTYFLVYSVVIYDQTRNYLVKYRQTTDFYRLVQEMRFRSGTIYVYRELFFRWSNFSYLTTNDLDRLYQLVEKSQSIMQQYLNDQSDIQTDDYLLSDTYMNYITQVENSNLCNFIDPQYINITSYCSIALDGVLLKGMIPSLNYISSAIRNQQAINNFTKRAEVHFYELEGGQIICQVFTNVSKILQQGMIDLTQKFNQTNEILSYIFLVTQLSLSIAILSCFKKSLMNEFTMYKKSLYLIPIQVLLGDNSLERALRQYEFTEKI